MRTLCKDTPLDQNTRCGSEWLQPSRGDTTRWLDLPIVNPDDRDHFLSAMEARAHIEENNVEFSALKQFLPAGKANLDEQKSIKFSKEQDKGCSFIASKVRASVCCDRCAARRVI